MTEPAAPDVPATPAAPAAPARAAVSRALIASLALAALLAMLALALAGWNAYSNKQDIDGLRLELAKRLAEVEAQSKIGRAHV